MFEDFFLFLLGRFPFRVHIFRKQFIPDTAVIGSITAEKAVVASRIEPNNFHLTVFNPWFNKLWHPVSQSDLIIGPRPFVNPNLGGLFRGWFCSGGVKLPLKLVRITLGTWNLVRKYTHIYSFRKYTF